MITNEVIDIDYALRNILKLFPSSLIVNVNYEIEAVSKNIADLLQQPQQDLIGKNLYDILDHIPIYIKEHFADIAKYGYIKPKQFSINTKLSGSIYIEVSGFHLGVLSDVSDLIVLFVQDLNKLMKCQSKLDVKVDEFNELVYRTYHDVKGPLATIQGLVNLSKYNADKNETSKILDLIDETVKILARRVTNISQFHFDYDPDKNKSLRTNLNRVEKEVIDILNSNFGDSNIKFKIFFKNSDFVKYDPDVIIRVVYCLLNGAKYFENQSDYPTLALHVKEETTFLSLDFRFKSFICPERLKAKIIGDKMCLACSIKDESILWFYVLGTILRQIDGQINYNMDNDDEIRCQIFLPF